MKFAVNLQGRQCIASSKGQRHDPHVYHVARKAVESISEPCAFFTYFWCLGVDALEPVEIVTAEPLADNDGAQA